jgi:hypothetical protein
VPWSYDALQPLSSMVRMSRTCGVKFSLYIINKALL